MREVKETVFLQVRVDIEWTKDKPGSREEAIEKARDGVVGSNTLGGYESVRILSAIEMRP